MTLNIAQVRERVAKRFTDFEQVDDSVIRFTKKAGDQPFAVCYLDVAQDLPGTPEMLTKYQDRVIGRHYFEGGKSLQWNNYLYFITSSDRLKSDEARKAKELIERDRTYARKFVILEDELDLVLTQPLVLPAEATHRTNVLSLWIDRLSDAGLDRAILSDDNLPKRLSFIESTSAAPAKGSKRPAARTAAVKPPPFIRSLQLTRFRDFPVQRDYTFGTVNLIFGPNASGKTSLLEAIELFYCGRNKRNPDLAPLYQLDAVLADGKPEKVNADRTLQEYRDRNLKWYGVLEVKTSKLYSSFSQFNFLDTDAAVSLTESTSHIEEDLSKLLVGPDASKTWDNINRVCDAVSAKLHDLRPLEKQFLEESAALKKSLDEAGSIKKESDSIRVRLEEMTRRIAWSGSPDNKAATTTMLLEALPELVSVAQQASGLDWTESPVSIDGLVKYCRETKATSETTEPDINRLEQLQKSQKTLADKVKRDRDALEMVEQAKRMLNAGMPERVAERGKHQSALARYSGWLAGLNVLAPDVLSGADLNTTIVACHQAATSVRTAAGALLAKTKGEYANFSNLRSQSLNLMQELRQIAGRILQSGSIPDQCPLCHTQFEPGDLETHMNMGVDEHLEVLGRTFLNQIQEQEAALGGATTREAACASLKTFCERAKLPASISVASVLPEVEKAKRELATAQSRIKVLDSELQGLESQGYSVTKLEEISAQLRRAGYPVSEFSREALDLLVSTVNQGLTTSSATVEAERKQSDELQRTLQTRLAVGEASVQNFRSSVSRFKERLAATESIRSKLNTFLASFPWPAAKPVAELAIEAESVRKVAAELQAALGREGQAQTTLAESTKRKELVDKQLTDLRPQMKRLIDAQKVLEDLKNNHSLSGAMQAALQENRGSIEAIFARIHSPAEFRGMGSQLATLVRKTNGQEATLSQISTGQRAAFALSIFLAQNAQLTAAPPVILIDDPIAHIDDLNSLSFLDYLRDVALTNRRQIYFATANDKLATLFERKFDFLGPEGFRRFNLQREARPVTS
jgi:exonuclease SbcC